MHSITVSRELKMDNLFVVVRHRHILNRELSLSGATTPKSVLFTENVLLLCKHPVYQLSKARMW